MILLINVNFRYKYVQTLWTRGKTIRNVFRFYKLKHWQMSYELQLSCLLKIPIKVGRSDYYVEVERLSYTGCSFFRSFIFLKKKEFWDNALKSDGCFHPKPT